MATAEPNFARQRSALAPPASSSGGALAETTRLSLLVKLYLIVIMIPVGFAVGPIYLTLLRLVSLLLVGPLLVMLLRGRFGRILFVDIAFFLHVIWVFIAISAMNPDRAIEFTGSLGVEFLGGYLLARALIRTREQFIAMVKWVLALTLLTLPLAIFESQTGNPIIINTINSLPGLRSETVAYENPRLGMARSQVVFGHPISYGIFCSLSFSLTFMALKGHMGDTRRVIAAILVGVCTFFSLSAGALLPLALQLALLSWNRILRFLEWRWMLLMGLMALGYVTIDLLSNRTPLRVLMTYATFSPHNAYYRTAINEWGLYNILGSFEHNIPPSIWFGVGLNDWVRPGWMHASSVDNFWLVNALRYGVPGFFLLALGFAAILIRVALRNFRTDPELERIRLAWMFTFLGLIFSLLSVHIWSATFSFVFFLLGAGAWLIFAQPNETEGAAPEARAAPEETEPATHYSRFPPVSRT